MPWWPGRGARAGEGSPQTSPDLLGRLPENAQGVRRLGARITLVLGAVAAILLIWVYLALDAREKRAAAPQKPGPASSRPAAPRTLSLDLDRLPRQGLIPAATAPSSVPEVDPLPTTPQSPSLPLPGGEGAYAQDWRDYYAARTDRAHADYERRLASLSAPAAVQTPFKPPPAQAPGAATPTYADASRAAQFQPRPPPSAMPTPDTAGWTGRDEDDAVLPRTVRPGRGRTELKAGTVINAVLLSGLDSDLPGLIQGQVTRDVFDTVSGANLLIPQGARLIGRYNSQVAYGQRRVQVAWNRIIFPDGSSLDLVAMPGSDQAGNAGFADRVDSHYGRLFTGAIAVSAFGAAAQLSQANPQPSNLNGGYNYAPGQVAAGQMGQQLSQLGADVTRKQLQVQPTLNIRPGYRFTVVLTQDVVLPVWKDGP